MLLMLNIVCRGFCVQTIRMFCFVFVYFLDFKELKFQYFNFQRSNYDSFKTSEFCCKEGFHHCMYCVKSVRIRSYSGPYFPAFRLNMERCGISLRIQSKCGRIRTIITPNTDIFHAV